MQEEVALRRMWTAAYLGPHLPALCSHWNPAVRVRLATHFGSTAVGRLLLRSPLAASPVDVSVTVLSLFLKLDLAFLVEGLVADEC